MAMTKVPFTHLIDKKLLFEKKQKQVWSHRAIQLFFQLTVFNLYSRYILDSRIWDMSIIFEKLEYILTHLLFKGKTSTLLCKSKPVTFDHIFKEPLSCFEPSGSAGLLCCRRLACWDARNPRPSLQPPPASSPLLPSHIARVLHCLPGNKSFN